MHQVHILAQTPRRQQPRKEMMKGTAMGELWRRIKKEFLAPVPEFTIVELTIALMFIVACIVDVSTDIIVAAEYFDKEMPLYGALTSIVIVISSFFVCACGLYNYEMEYRNEGRFSPGGPVASKRTWICRIVFTVLQLGLVWRTVEYIASGYKSRTADTEKERQWYQKAMLRKQRVIRVLGLADSFMESAPQLCLQLYVLIKLNPRKDVVGEVLRVVGLLSSWFSLAGAVVGWYKSRLEDAGKEVGLKSQVIYILWRLAETGGRVLCIAYFASVFGLWVLLVLVVHWVVLLLWYLIFFKNGTNDGTLVFVGSSAIYTYSLMFCYLHHQEGPSRYRYIVFYIIFYLENFVMLAVASSFTEDPGSWFHTAIVATVPVLFLTHIGMQLMFYGCCHPTQDQIHICLPCDRHTVQESLLGGTQRYSFTASYTDTEISYANPLVMGTLDSRNPPSPARSVEEPLNEESAI